VAGSLNGVDPRTPVLIGAGQVHHRDGDAPEPVDLLAEAARRAVDDCGAPRVLQAIASVRVVNMLSRRYPDPGALVAERLGVPVGHTVLTTEGGQMPQALVDRAARDIVSGLAGVVLVGGAESWRTRNAYRRRGERPPWSVQPDGTGPSETFGEPLRMTSPGESALGLTDPVQAYPMFEQALRSHTGRSLAGQVATASDLWSRFSRVAVSNPYAAVPRYCSPEEIRTPGPANRMIGFPYPKLMNSNSSVDQGAALLLCAAGTARDLGVPRDRWVFLHGAAEGEDTTYLSERQDLGGSPAITLAGATALELAGIGVGEVAHVDLYSCFPSAVQVAAAALGLPLERRLTVTGGLTFAGGPWNNYVSHSIATMLGLLREDPDAFGLCTANGGLLTKHAVAVYSCRPVTGPVDPAARVRSVREDLAATVTTRTAAPRYDGTARVETWTVMHDRDGRPERAYVFAAPDDARRTLATTDEPELLDVLTTTDILGRVATVQSGALKEVR